MLLDGNNNNYCTLVSLFNCNVKIQHCVKLILILYIYSAADLSEEVKRVRPARFFQSDSLVRPYVRDEAEGNKILSVS